ncbi:MAG: hypothetical protein HKN47_07640 [Pirellulaceae bacterium]|nr:hypothetical protein [Pirellulaceae bacterium]
MLTPFRLILLLCLAAGGPYVASETDIGRKVVSTFRGLFRPQGQNGSTLATIQSPSDRTGGIGGSFWNQGSGDARGAADASYANHSHYEVEKLRRESAERFRYDDELVRKLSNRPADQSAPPLVGEKTPDLRAIMRFDVTPDDVIKRFARVSTVLADSSLQGLRVPIVTGTSEEDLAGTMTYYFDNRGHLQRLTLHGFTGNPNKIVQTMTSHYAMSQEPTLEAGVYTKRWNGQPVHFLRLTHAPVVYHDAVHQKYTVFLELNEPNLTHGISNEARRIVSADRSTGRW